MFLGDSFSPTKPPVRRRLFILMSPSLHTGLWAAGDCNRRLLWVVVGQGAALRPIILNRDCCRSEKSEQSLEPLWRPKLRLGTVPECSHEETGVKIDGRWWLPSRDLWSKERQAWHAWHLCSARLLSLDFRVRRLLRSECLRPPGTGMVIFSLVVMDSRLILLSLRRRGSEGEETGETRSSGRAQWEGRQSFFPGRMAGWLNSDWSSNRGGVGLIDLGDWIKARRWAMWLDLRVSITGALPLRAAPPNWVLCPASQTSLFSQERGRSARKRLLLWHY